MGNVWKSWVDSTLGILWATWQCQSASPLDPGIRPSKWRGFAPVSGTGWFFRVLGFLGWFRSIPLQFQPYSKHIPTINVTPNFHHPLSQASRIPHPPIEKIRSSGDAPRCSEKVQVHLLDLIQQMNLNLLRSSGDAPRCSEKVQVHLLDQI